MLDLIRIAYNVDPEKVSGGPSWLEMDRFDILAITPAASNAEARRQMLQRLLADRFKLVTHQDKAPMAAFALTVGKRAQLKQSDGAGDSGCNFAVQNAPGGGGGRGDGGGGPITLPVIAYTCKNTTMAAFAEGMLSIPGAGAYFNNKLVVDQTKLEGGWDFTIRFTPKIPTGIATTGENIPFPEALEQQLGLKLESSTVPMPMIVVDSVNRTPTPNSPDAMKHFPPLPKEFEVASLKPSDPATAGGRGGGRPDIKNGRLYVPGIPLKVLVIIGWDLNGDEMLVGAPKWMDEDRYDIIAKAPAGVALGDMTPQRNGVPVNIDAIRPMIRSLVVERFKLVSHMEDRPVNTYVLTAPKPKLKQADPASRTRWQEGVQPDSKGNKNANSSLGRLVTCQNVSMAQFADMLPGIAPGYVHTEVVDATGLEGGWDFTFSFSPMGALRQVQAQAGSAASSSAPPGTITESPDTPTAISLFDAVSKQLGLKLEAKKKPKPVLVIDSVERQPTEN
jgi:uncharacterized protein (TIGR03435 family)